MAFELVLLRIVALLAGCSAAAYTDARTGLILDSITYPMIALGIALDIIQGEWLWLLAGIAVFAIGYAVYYAGKVGGGDVKLFTGIAFLMPAYQGNFFLAGALFAACILAVAFYSAFYVAKYAEKGIDWKENRPGIQKAAVFGIALAAWLAAMAFLGAVSAGALGLLALAFSLALLFIAFEKGIRHSFFLKLVPVGKLEEDEVIAAEFLDSKTKGRLGLGFKGVFGKKEIELLVKAGIKEVPVYRGMPPFGPFILLGCIAAIIWPNFIGMMFA
jgi:Flp pilus assembly protein protease CpaA